MAVTWFLLLLSVSSAARSNLVELLSRKIIEDGHDHRQHLISECLQGITALASRRDRDVVILFRGNSNDAVLRAVSYPIVILKEDMKSKRYRLSMLKEIAYVFSTRPINKILGTIFWDPDTRFVVVCPHAAMLQDLLEEFWDLRVANIVALIYEEGNHKINLYTYFPYSEKHCATVIRPALLQTWKKGDKFPEASRSLFPHKFDDLKKCRLFVTLLQRPPSVMVDDDDEIIGVEVDILKSVAYALNATPDFQLLHRKRTTGPGNILMQELTENLSDVVAGSLMFTTSVSIISEGITYSESFCVTWAIPKAHTLPLLLIVSTSLPITFFSWSLACMILSMLVLYILLKYHNRNITFSDAAWACLSHLLGGPRHTPLHLSSCVFFVLWLWGSFMICKLFESSVSSTGLVHGPNKQMETIQEILESKLFIQGETFLMAEVLPRYISEGYSWKIRNHSIVANKALQIIARDKNIAFLGSASNIRHYWSPEAEDNVYLQPQCLTSYSPVIQVRKNSPFYHVITKYIRGLNEFGIIRKYFHFYERASGKRERESLVGGFKPLQLKDVAGAFRLWVFCNNVNVFVFLVEVLYPRLAGKLKALRDKCPRRNKR